MSRPGDGRRKNYANLGDGSAVRWKPGQSGNPGGETRAQKAVRKLQHELIGAATEGGQEIIDFVLAVFRGEKEECNDSKSLRWAADFLADRLWGRAPMTVTVKPAQRVDISDLKAMPLAELERLAAGELEAPPALPEPETDDEAPSGDVH